MNDHKPWHACTAAKQQKLFYIPAITAMHITKKGWRKKTDKGKSTKQVKQIPIKENTHQKHLNYQTSFPGFKLIFKSKLQSVRI